MLENYIDLTLTDGKEDLNLDQIVLKNKNVVLLGVPGSGKSVLLEHFYDTHKEECELLCVKEFVKMPIFPKPSTKYFLLDGLDELRCAAREKEAVIYDIVNKLKQIEGKCTTLISCREMDWYGDNDDVALEKHLSYPVKKVYVKNLSNEQKESFVSLYLKDSERIKDFNSKVLKNDGSKELLNVPQTLTMLLKLYNEHPEGVPTRKIELYENIVKISLEQKKAIIRNNRFNLSEDEVFKYAGYIAYFYMMSDFDEIDETSILKISESSRFENEKLKSVVELNVFEDKGQKKFSHRTIAEYLCAHFLFNQKMKKDNFSVEEILDWLLSTDKKRVPSDLRGVYAWFCSMTKNEKSISIDPYGQYCYGDNSLFEPKLKEIVVKAIECYADKIKPYFLRIGDLYKNNNFYEPALDDFLIQSFRNSLKNKNNYLLFLGFLMTSASAPTCKMLEFAKEIVAIPNLEYHFKEMFIDYLKKDTDYLKNRLQEIIDEKIKDPENLFLDRILSILYPDIIKPSEIIRYLKKYKKNGCDHDQFHYLKQKQISQDNLNDLVDAIYCEDDLKKDNYNLKTIEVVVGNYLQILLREQPPEVFLKKLASLAQKDFSFTYRAWSSVTNDLQKISEKTKREVYLNYLINTTANDKSQQEICWAKKCCLQMFVMSILPSDCECVYTTLLKSNKSEDFKLEILYEMFAHIRSNGKLSCDAEEIVSNYAQKYGLLDPFKKRISPDLSSDIAKMKKKNEEDAKEKKRKTKEKVDANRKALNEKTVEEKESLWGLLINCATFYITSNESEVENNLGLCLENYHEMLSILKNKIYQNPQKRVYLEHTNIQSLVKLLNNAPSAKRNVDILYYAILCLNDEKKYEEIKDESFLEYLYLIALFENNVINYKKAKFLNWFDSEKLEGAIKIVQDFILLFFEKENDIFQKLSSFFNKIYSNCNDKSERQVYLKKLQSVVYFTDKELTRQEEIVKNLMLTFDFQLDPELLKEFKLNDILAARRNSLIKLIQIKKRDLIEDFIDKGDIENLIEIFGFKWYSFSIKSIIKDYQLIFIECMMFYFDSEESMTFHSGYQSNKDEAAFYVNNAMLKQLNGIEGKTLLTQLLEKCSNILWKPRIQTRIAEIEEVLADNLKIKKTVDEAKKRVLKIKEEPKVTMIFNGDVKNSAVVGTANHSPINVNAEENVGFDFETLKTIVAQISEELAKSANIDAQTMETLNTKITELEKAVEEKNEKSAVTLLQDIATGAISSGIWSIGLTITTFLSKISTS